MRIPFTQVDAFAGQPFAGNPAAVMPLDAWLPDSTLQAIAAENNLSETAFTVAADNGGVDYDLRWFTPTTEVVLCGHATLASGHVLLGDRHTLRFRTRKAGVLTVTRDGDLLTLELPAWPPAPNPVPGLAEALGAAPATVLTRGDDYVLAVYDSAAQVRALAPDFRAIAALKGGDVLCIVTAPGDAGHDVVSRAFAPGAGIDEDPVTGSAHAILAPYWAARLGRERFRAFQASARGGEVDCRLAGDRVVLGGRCVTVIEGVFILPD